MGMLKKLPGPVVMILGALLVWSNTAVAFVPLSFLALLKLAIPIRRWRTLMSRALAWIAETWVRFNSLCIRTFTSTTWEVEGLEGLSRETSYMVICNHQSWVDIPVLQMLLLGKVPFLRFFLKQQLIWVPLLGIAWWALDYPFMKRYGKQKLARHPELRGKDLETTKKACEKFKDVPVAVINFLEGTRITPDKHVAAGMAFRHLLPPRAGGLAFVLGAMGSHLGGLLDVTIVYPAGIPTVYDLFKNRIPRVRLLARRYDIPADFIVGDYAGDPGFRERFQAWVTRLWMEKDELMERQLLA